MKRTTKRGFTLIELLVVVAIIAILAGILLPTLAYIKDRANRGVAQTTINNLTMAMEQYNDDFGLYPHDDLGTGTFVVFLDGDPGNGGPRSAYFSFKPESIRGGDFIDPFDDPYFYNELESEGLDSATSDGTGDPSAIRINVDSFDIWSMGGNADQPESWMTNYRKDPGTSSGGSSGGGGGGGGGGGNPSR